LINFFYGLEIPKDLPPLVSPIGPVLPDEYSPLSQDHKEFLLDHPNTLYVALGAEAILSKPDTTNLIKGLYAAIRLGHIDGIIWSFPKIYRQGFDVNTLYTRKDYHCCRLQELLMGRDP
jgi:hypothetical protein